MKLSKKYIMLLVTIFLLVLAIIVVYSKLVKPKNHNLSSKNFKMKELNIIPLDFKNNDFIPPKFTCDGENLFPRIEIKNIPKNTKSLAIIVEDPDAPMERPFIHLLAVNIPISGDNIILDKNLLNLAIL
jgi:phosphatidylethanolamine-binding protein (PEBP) family uncharacterized protein